MTAKTWVMTDDTFEKSYTMRRSLGGGSTSPYDLPAWEYGVELEAVNINDAIAEAETCLASTMDGTSQTKHYVLWTPKHSTLDISNIRQHQKMWGIAADIFAKFVPQHPSGYEVYERKIVSPTVSSKTKSPKFHPSGYIYNEAEDLWEYHES